MDNTTAISLLNEKLGDYCLRECPAKCCHIGKLLVSEKFVAEFGVNATERKDGCFDLEIQGGCPLLKNNRCTIQTNPMRPKICGEYPFFNRSSKIIIASSCKAVESGLFNETLKELDKNDIKWDIQ